MKITCCSVPETHPVDAGTLLPVRAVLVALLDPPGVPRDGVTISGGERFLQPRSLLLVLQKLKAHRIHTVDYTAHALGTLARRSEPEVQAALADGASEWSGSRNQGLVANLATALTADGPHLRGAHR